MGAVNPKEVGVGVLGDGWSGRSVVGVLPVRVVVGPLLQILVTRIEGFFLVDFWKEDSSSQGETRSTVG